MRGRAVLVVVALLGSMLSLGAVAATSAPAGAVTPGGERNFSLRYTNNVNGQIVMGGNTLMRCPTDTVDANINSSCAKSLAGTFAGNNNAYDMKRVDIDGDPSTFDSSSADVAVDGRVLFAGLYWTGVQKKGLVITGNNGYAGVPQPALDESAIGTVKVKAPGSTIYRTVTASQIDTGPIANNSGYGAFADITGIVAGSGPGSYTVADVQTATGGNIAAGWTIVVAYANENEPLRNLSVFDGLKVVSSSKPLSLPLSGFKTPSSGTVRTAIGVVAAEGDAGTTGDYLTINDNLLTDAVHPSNNTENSTIANRGSLVTAKNPNVPNQLGYDSSTFVADGYLGNGDTSAVFAAKTTNDVYAPQAITFATELFSPDVTLTKTASVVSGGYPGPVIGPGGVLRYTITATNNGTQNAQSVHLLDAIPANSALMGVPLVTSGVGAVSCTPLPCNATTTAITGTLGAGGVLAPTQSVTVEFDVVVDGATGDGLSIDNSAQIDFVSPDLGLPITKYASATTPVGYPDPAVRKSLVSSSGTQYTYAIDVQNVGSVPTTGSVEITDTLGATGSIVSIGGTGWTCAALICSRTDALAPTASYPTITVVANFGAGQDALNTATLTGTDKGGEPTFAGSPALLNDVGYASGGTSPVSNLEAFKAFFESAVTVGTPTRFVIAVRNPGPANSTNNVITDVVPAGLRILGADVVGSVAGSCTVSGQTIACTMPTLAVGEETGVFVQVVADISAADTTITNTTTATSDTTTSPATASADLYVRPIADLRLVKTADISEAMPGGAVTYTMTVTNDGPNAAQDVTVIDHLPDAIDPATVVFNGDGTVVCTGGDSIASCTWPGSTAVGQTRTMSILANFRSVVPVADRHAVNVAETSSATDELDPSSNIDSAVVKVLPYADVEADVLSNGAISPNGEATITFVMTNNGPSPATDGVMSITIDPALTIVTVPDGCVAAGQVLTCSVGDIANGGSVSLDVVVRAGDVPAGTSYLNEVHVSSDALDPIDPILANNLDNGLLVVGLPPAIISVGPDSGGTDGGNEVVVEGENLTPETNVDIGGVPCTGVEFISSMQISCTVGPHEPGTVDVTVTNPDGLQAVLPGGYTFKSDFVPPAFTG